jgi:PKD repeat protein
VGAGKMYFLVRILPNDTICFGTNATFQFDAHGENIDSATWTFVPNKTYTQTIYNSDEVTFDSTTTRSVGFKNLYLKVRFVNDEICFDTAQIKIEKSINPPAIKGPEIVCLDSSYIYTVNQITGGTVEWNITNGTVQASTDKSITVRWTVSGKKNKIVKARFHVGECYSDWSTLYVTDIDSIDQLISGNPYPCEDTAEVYLVLSHPTYGKHKWILNPVFGEILAQNEFYAKINWHIVPHDTTIILTYQDSLCGGIHEFNYPITIVKRFQGEITNSTACANKDILFSVNVMASEYLWDFGDGTFGTTNNITHKYADRGFYRVNVRWTGAMGCVEGFSATKEIEVEPTLEPYIKAFNNNTNEFIDCLTTDTVEIRFQANEYNVQDVKYRWFIDTIEQTDDTTSTLIRTHPTDFDFTKVFVKLFVEGPICSDTAYLRLDTCVSPIGCEPYDTVRITSIIDSTCYIRNANGAFLPFNLFLIDTINITPGYPTPHYAYRRGEWIFEDIRTVRKNVINQVDLINQSHEYQKAGYWLIKLIGNARDNIDTTQLCRDSDSRIDTIPMVSDFIYTFSCDSAGYKIKVKAQATYVQGFTPDHFTYYYNGNNYNAPDGDDIEFRIVDTVDQVCLMVSSGDYSCQKCITINIPAELLSPEIKITDTICASTALQFDIMDENFTDDITSYLWDFGDGIQSRIRRPIHVFSIFDTTATVSLYVTNKWGCMAMSTKTVAIVKNTLSGYLTVDSLQCESHREINFNKQTGRSPLSYLWNTSDTTSSIIINQTGTYDITVTDPYGCKVILDTFVPVSESFTNELVGPDSICSNLVNPKFTFYGSNSLYDYFVTEKELPSGSEDTIAFSFLGNNIYEFTFDKTGKTGVYRITIRAYLEGTQTICDSIIHEIKINEPDIPLILDSLNSCKPYTYILKESNNLNLKWYEIGSQGLFVLDTGSQISVHKGGKYIGFYTNSHGCTETDTVEIEDQINLRPFISGCYEICDTILDKGNVFIPILGDDVTYNWWKYKHLDSNFVIKQGTNSKVDSFLRACKEFCVSDRTIVFESKLVKKLDLFHPFWE